MSDKKEERSEMRDEKGETRMREGVVKQKDVGEEDKGRLEAGGYR